VVQFCATASKLDIAQEALFWGQFAALGPAVADELFGSSIHNARIEFGIKAKRYLNVFKSPEKIKEAEVALKFERTGSKKLSFSFKREDDFGLGADIDLANPANSTANISAGAFKLGFGAGNPVDSSLSFKKEIDLFTLSKCEVPILNGKFSVEGKVSRKGSNISAGVLIETLGGVLRFRYPLLELPR
jgi:hypothetical protein